MSEEDYKLFLQREYDSVLKKAETVLNCGLGYFFIYLFVKNIFCEKIKDFHCCFSFLYGGKAVVPMK